jgi:hypothetical protein
VLCCSVDAFCTDVVLGRDMDKMEVRILGRGKTGGTSIRTACSPVVPRHVLQEFTTVDGNSTSRAVATACFSLLSVRCGCRLRNWTLTICLRSNRIVAYRKGPDLRGAEDQPRDKSVYSPNAEELDDYRILTCAS